MGGENPMKADLTWNLLHELKELEIVLISELCLSSKNLAIRLMLRI